MHPKRFMLLVVFMLNVLVWGVFAPRPVYAASVLYAVPGGTGDCHSWGTACSLQQALSSAVSGDQIWVKKGTHTPGASGSARTVTFTLKNGVALYGGFAGTEGSLGDRNWTANQTILSGDLNGNGKDDNDALHVVTAKAISNSTVLDGFTITGGNANGDAAQRSGGGLYIPEGSVNSNLTLSNLVISDNYAFGLGGGSYQYNASPVFNHVTFSNNISDYYGGALYLFQSSPSLTDVSFIDNKVTAGDGGAIYTYQSSPTLNKVTFRGNRAIALTSGNTSAGGSGGAMYLTSSSNPILTNIVFSGNNAGGLGGAMDLENSSPILSNVTFNGNSSVFSGNTIFMYGSSPQIRNSIIWGDAATQVFAFPGSLPVYTRVILKGGGATVDADPLFVNADAGDLRLRPASPAINFGDNTITSPVLPATDLDGNPRVADGTVDLGAYENQGPYNTAPVFSGSMSNLTLLEDPANNPGSQVSSLLAGHVTDADGAANSAGMAVFAADNTNGAWQFSKDSGATWTALGTLSGTSSTLLGPDVLLRFVPNTNWNGTTTLSFRAWDIPPDLRVSGTSNVNSTIYGGKTSFSADTGTISLIVTPVNDAPSFTKGADQVELKNSGGQTVRAWATLLSKGPGDEAGQLLNFIVDNDNKALFSVQPAISPSGELTYTPAANTIGSATVSVSLQDDGGTANGGLDTSAVQTFTITVKNILCLPLLVK